MESPNLHDEDVTCHPLKESSWAVTTCLFSWCNCLCLPAPSCLHVPAFVQHLRAPCFLLDWKLLESQITEIKPVGSFRFTQLNFVFLTLLSSQRLSPFSKFPHLSAQGICSKSCSSSLLLLRICPTLLFRRRSSSFSTAKRHCLVPPYTLACFYICAFALGRAFFSLCLSKTLLPPWAFEAKFTQHL